MRRLFGIHCGADTPNGLVSDLSFSRFLEAAVSPKFPGFTVRAGIGYWNGEAEPTREIVILAHDDEPTHDEIREIARRYAERYGQESVLVIAQTVSGEFLS